MGDNLDRQVFRMLAWLFGGIIGFCALAVLVISRLPSGTWKTVSGVLLLGACLLWTTAVVSYWGSAVMDRFRADFPFFKGVVICVFVCGIGTVVLVKRLVTGAW